MATDNTQYMLINDCDEIYTFDSLPDLQKFISTDEYDEREYVWRLYKAQRLEYTVERSLQFKAVVSDTMVLNG